MSELLIATLIALPVVVVVLAAIILIVVRWSESIERVIDGVFELAGTLVRNRR